MQVRVAALGVLDTPHEALMNGTIRWLVGAVVILVLAYLAVSHDYNLDVGPGRLRLEHREAAVATSPQSSRVYPPPLAAPASPAWAQPRLPLVSPSRTAAHPRQ